MRFIEFQGRRDREGDEKAVDVEKKKNNPSSIVIFIYQPLRQSNLATNMNLNGSCTVHMKKHIVGIFHYEAGAEAIACQNQEDQMTLTVSV